VAGKKKTQKQRGFLGSFPRTSMYILAVLGGQITSTDSQGGSLDARGPDRAKKKKNSGGEDQEM